MKITVTASTEAEAVKVCKEKHGWTPDAVREVDSGEDGTTAYVCFDNAADAEIWDNQK